jgi:hypothetical protein
MSGLGYSPSTMIFPYDVPVSQPYPYAVPVPQPYFENIIQTVDMPIQHTIQPVLLPTPVGVPFPQPVPVPYDRPYAVPYPQPMPYPVDRPCAVPVPVGVPYPQPYAVPQPILVREHVGIPVPVPYAVPVQTPQYTAQRVSHRGTLCEMNRRTHRSISSPCRSTLPRHRLVVSNVSLNNRSTLNGLVAVVDEDTDHAHRDQLH